MRRVHFRSPDSVRPSQHHLYLVSPYVGEQPKLSVELRKRARKEGEKEAKERKVERQRKTDVTAAYETALYGYPQVAIPACHPRRASTTGL